MTWSMEATRMAQHRTVCDVCEAHSSAPRGAACRVCGTGTLRYLSELQLLRNRRKAARRAERAQT
jgi:ribosomal protein L40E